MIVFEAPEADATRPPDFDVVVAITDSALQSATLFVDGQEQIAVQASLFGRAVVVPAGEHEVTWRFSPRLPAASLLASWLGLVPSLDQSGESRRNGAITKTGSSYARRLLVEAARGGICCEYIGRILKEVKRRPMFVIDEKIGFPGYFNDLLSDLCQFLQRK